MCAGQNLKLSGANLERENNDDTKQNVSLPHVCRLFCMHVGAHVQV